MSFLVCLSGGRESGIKGLKLLSGREIKNLEPNVIALAGIYSPFTGIIDSFSLRFTFMTVPWRKALTSFTNPGLRL